MIRIERCHSANISLSPGSRRDGEWVVMRIEPIAISARVDTSYPCRIIQIPTHGLSNSSFKARLRLPPEFHQHLVGVDRVTAVVAGPILHEANQRLAACAIRGWPQLVDDGAHGAHDCKIASLGITALSAAKWITQVMESKSAIAVRRNQIQ